MTQETDMETDITDRLAAYKKYLSAFKKVSISTMATHFNESKEKIIGYLEEQITAGDLPFRINGPDEYLERYEPDATNVLIQDVVREGGLLAQIIQKKVETVRNEQRELEQRGEPKNEPMKEPVKEPMMED